MQSPTSLNLQVPVQTKMITQEEQPVPLKNDQVLRRACSDVVAESDKLINGFDMNLSLKINKNKVEMVECECCGLCEECTPTYIMSIKDSFRGKWICGLCSEAVKEKTKRNPGLTIDRALENHGAFCKQFNRTIRINPQLSLAGAMRDIARRSSQNRNSTKVFCESKIARTISCDPFRSYVKVQTSSFQ